jgi:3-phenylpropionate/cinnamic acid dioxygenase small subunit
MKRTADNKRNLLAERPGKSTYFDNAYYDRLLEIAGSWAQPGPPVSTEIAEDIKRLLIIECRLLDDQRLEDWLELFSEQCAYWIPSSVGVQDPRIEITWELHDRRRLEDRIARLRTGTAFSQVPPTRTRRCLSNIEIWSVGESEIRARTNLVIHTHRKGVHRALPCMIGYVLNSEAPGEWLIEVKQINLIDPDHGQHNNSFVL